MLKRLLRSVAFLVAAAGQGALAQNSDLGLLLGLSLPASGGSGSQVKSSVGASIQVNYAYQLLGTRTGDLYLEFPVVVSGGNSADVGAFGVVASQGATVLFTPGVRFKLPFHSRLSLYGAAGGGVGAFGGNRVMVSHGQITIGHVGASGAIDFGGGLDVRLTRLLSVRGEVRDFVSLGRLDGAGRNHVFTQFGIAFHF